MGDGPEDSNKLSGLRRLLRPPLRLRRVPQALRLPVSILWFAFLALAVMSQLGGLWRGYVQATVVDEQFARVGLSTDYADADYGIVVSPATPGTERLGVPEEGTIEAIDGLRVPATMAEYKLGRLLDGQDGAVTVRIRASDGSARDYRLPRNRTVRDAALGAKIPRLASYAWQGAFGAVGAIALLAAAILLVRRRPGDPVALLLSLCFLAAIASLQAGLDLYVWLEADWLQSLMLSIWIGLLIAVLPAFPDGRFVPRWGGWLAVGALPMTLVSMLEATPEWLSNLLTLGFALAAVTASIVRYRRTEPGLQRQQLKWAAFGFAGSILFLTCVVILVSLIDLLPEGAQGWALVIGLCLFNISFILLPVGVLVAILRFRLWDADAAIGRSLAYALITLVLAGVWAASSELVEQIVTGQLGDGAAPVAASIATIVAGLVFGPASERINAWMDTHFQPGLVKLRKLPERLLVWQHGDRPEDVGERIVRAMVDSLRACRAAMLLHTPDGYVSLATESVESDEVNAWIAAHGGTDALKVDNLDKRDSLFPVRIVLEDAGKPIGALLLGPRSDGNIYAKVERNAVEAIEAPLAAALRQAQRRRLKEASLDRLIGTLDARLNALEAVRLGKSAA